MALFIAGQTIVMNLEEGEYPAVVRAIKETQDVTLKGGAVLPAVEIEFELETGNKHLSKKRKYIATDKEGSELRLLIEKLIPEADFEAGVDLNDLIDKKCRVVIIENISRKGNRFMNIDSVKVADIDG